MGYIFLHSLKKVQHQVEETDKCLNMTSFIQQQQKYLS